MQANPRTREGLVLHLLLCVHQTNSCKGASKLTSKIISNCFCHLFVQILVTTSPVTSKLLPISREDSRKNSFFIRFLNLHKSFSLTISCNKTTWPSFMHQGLVCKILSLSEICTHSLHRKNRVTQNITQPRCLFSFIRTYNSVFYSSTLSLHLTLITSSKTLCPNPVTVEIGFQPMHLEQSRVHHLTEASLLTTTLRCKGQRLALSLYLIKHVHAMSRD